MRVSSCALADVYTPCHDWIPPCRAQMRKYAHSVTWASNMLLEIPTSPCAGMMNVILVLTPFRLSIRGNTHTQCVQFDETTGIRLIVRAAVFIKSSDGHVE